MSNGGFFAHRLACELSERIAAIAPVAGTLGVDDCAPTRRVPVMHFHGTEDPLVPYQGGLPLTGWSVQGDLDFTSVDETIDFWRDANNCSTSASDHFLKGDSACIAGGSCSDDASVVRCVVDGGGHTWPGGLPIPFLGKTTTDMDASALMVDFFEDNPLP
jgi:polyhydroxybutyrate depolymerase